MQYSHRRLTYVDMYGLLRSLDEEEKAADANCCMADAQMPSVCVGAPCSNSRPVLC
jgi:hypothetical protein